MRPEVVRLGPAASGIRGVVLDVGFRGSGFTCRIAVEGLEEPLKVELPAESGAPALGSTVAVGWEEASVCLLPRLPE